uniref:Vomeronasal type-1 receptor n=1 Tax=Sus scrofa TaxID=9823 RepID=A0A8D1V6G1_PIG
VNENNKLSRFIDIRNAFFSEVGTGVSANTMLLFHILTFLLEHRLKPMDLAIGHLALFHLFMLLTVAFMASDIFGSQKTWDDIKCKLVLYLYRLMRVTQAITLSPRNSCLAKFKHESSHHNLYYILFLWVSNMATSSNFLVSIIATPNVTVTHLLFVTKSFSLYPMIYFLRYLYFALVIFQDVSMLVLMALSSGYMVILLYRHQKQTWHLHSTKLSLKASPEKKGHPDHSVAHEMLWNNNPVHLCVHMLVRNGYASISPLVLIIPILAHQVKDSIHVCKDVDSIPGLVQ